MTEKTFTIEQIEKAAIKLAHTSLGDEWVMEDLIAALTEPEFKPEVEQVVFSPDAKYEHASGFLPYKEGIKHLAGIRAQTQTEVGPDWVSAEDFKKLAKTLQEELQSYDELMAEFVKLRDALESVSINANLTGIGPRKEAQLALDAIPDKYRSK